MDGVPVCPARPAKGEGGSSVLSGMLQTGSGRRVGVRSGVHRLVGRNGAAQLPVGAVPADSTRFRRPVAQKHAQDRGRAVAATKPGSSEDAHPLMVMR